MKTKIAREATKITLFAAALLATCLLAGSASAQATFQGKFTLPFETHWGQATLPAGEYLLSFDEDRAFSEEWVIRDAKSGRRVACEPAHIIEDAPAGKSALLIGGRGTRHVVYALRITDLGETFVYDPALAHAAAVEEARRAQSVPVIVAQR